MMKLSAEEREDLAVVVNHHSFKHIYEIVDEIISRMQVEVATVPLTGLSPNDAMLALYAKRFNFEGASALKNAMKSRINELKYVKEGDKK